MRAHRVFIILLSFLFSTTAIAQALKNSSLPAVNAPSQVGTVALGSGQHIVTVLVGLVGIVVLILIFAWFARRFNGGSWLKTAHMKIIATMPLGTRERLLLVEVGGQQLLLGVTAQSISTLHTLETPVKTSVEPPESSDFSQKLLSMLNKQAPKVSSESEAVGHDH